MEISKFFKIFNLHYPGMDKVNYYVHQRDYTNAKKELLKYFIDRKEKFLSTAEPLSANDASFPLAYIARHFILSGPNELDYYLSSMFLAHSDDYTSLDVLPFLKEELSFMLMSRQKEKEGALFYSPKSIFPPFLSLTLHDGSEIKLDAKKYAYISTKLPDEPLCDEDIYEICEDSDSYNDAYGMNTGRVYLSFDLSQIGLENIASARFAAKISIPSSLQTKELLLFNISDTSWDNSLTWNRVLGNIYSWENSPTGPSWDAPEGCDCEYLNVTCRFWFARPMAYQYLSDVEKNAVYGEKLLFLMNAFSQKKDGGYNRVLETGERLSNFTCVLNALVDTPAMTPDYLVSILHMMYRDIKHLMLNPDLGWSNWAVVRTSGLSKAIDFLPELNECSEWKDSTRSLMSSLFDRMYSADFSFKESGLAYSFWCMNLFSSAIKSAQMNNDPYSAFMRNRLEKAFDASLDLLYPNFYDTNIGDSNYQSKLGYLKSTGSLFPTKKLKGLANGSDEGLQSLSACYPDANIVVMRNTLKKDSAIYLMLYSLPFDGHAHDDSGSIVLYAYNRPLLVDNGRYGYSKSNISSYLKTARAHNSVEIEGYTPAPHSESDNKIEAFLSNSAFGYALSSSKAYKELNATHKRRVFFLKNEGFVIVSDYITTDTPAMKFNQNWHFMPSANPVMDPQMRVNTNFSEDGNICLLCPDADTSALNDGIFSTTYGMAESSSYASFTKYGQQTSMTTLLYPYVGECKHISAQTLSPDEHTYSSAVFDIGSERCVFYAKNTGSGSFLDCYCDGEAVVILNGKIYMVNSNSLTINSTEYIKSPAVIKDMHLHISSGIVHIESSSLTKCTKRDEAVKIFAPKTTHVLLNGESIPFTSYSDYVYAVAAK